MKGESFDFRRNPLPFHTTVEDVSTNSSRGNGSNPQHHRARLSPGSTASPALTYASDSSSSSTDMSRKSSDGYPVVSSYARYDPYASTSAHSHHQHADMSRPQDHASASSLPRSAESSGASPWGEGMRSIMSSIIGAPSANKPKTMASASSTAVKSERSPSDPYAPLPLQAHEVQAATSHWETPRETIAMTMGFQGSYDDPSFVQPMWQSQQVASYPTEHGNGNSNNSASGFAAPYPQQPAPSGLPGAEATRARSSGEFAALSESRDYARRPLAPPNRSFNGNEYPAATPNTWWPEHGGSVGDSNSHLPSHDPRGQHWSSAGMQSGRRVNPPPLPETRNTNRGAWSGMSSSSSSSSMGLDASQYEFPQSSLGKRPHEEDPANAAMSGNSNNNTAGTVDYTNDPAYRRYSLAPNDPAYRRYSLAPNMVFTRSPGGGSQSSAGMTTYRPPPAGMDPRRPSIGEHAYPNNMLAPQSSRPYPSSAVGSSGGASWSGWASGSHPSGLGANIGATPSPQSSPANGGWKDGMGRHGQDAGAVTASPSVQANGAVGAAGSAKRHRRQSSASGSAVAQQTDLLANTPFHITNEIVLRAPPGSKLEDVHYDQHCEIRTGMPNPPASEFEVAKDEDRPRLQTDKLRFPGDLYTPRWVRGTGNAREAWCDRCEHGNWLQLKNSQYWYDQVHKHGISSVSGLRFTAPTQLRVYQDAAGTVEGKCHQCKEWVLICTAKRRRNFAAFFKHAHACHSYRKASAVGNGPIVEHNPGHKKKMLAQQAQQQAVQQQHYPHQQQVQDQHQHAAQQHPHSHPQSHPHMLG